jgi:hypothetical protein
MAKAASVPGSSAQNGWTRGETLSGSSPPHGALRPGPPGSAWRFSGHRRPTFAPRRTLRTSADLLRIHPVGLGPWWFSSDGHG